MGGLRATFIVPAPLTVAGLCDAIRPKISCEVQAAAVAGTSTLPGEDPSLYQPSSPLPTAAPSAITCGHEAALYPALYDEDPHHRAQHSASEQQASVNAGTEFIAKDVLYQAGNVEDPNQESDPSDSEQDVAEWEVLEIIPEASAATEAAAAVRNLAVARLPAAWESLRQEFDVVVLIWGSLIRVGAAFDIPPPETKLKKLMQEALDIAEGAIPAGRTAALPKAAIAAGNLISEALQEDSKVGMLNTATSDAAKKVMETLQQTRLQNLLAKKLEATGNAISAVDCQHKAPDDELEKLIRACALADQAVENAVRQALGLPIVDPQPAKKEPAKGEPANATSTPKEPEPILIAPRHRSGSRSGSSSSSRSGPSLYSRSSHRSHSKRSKSRSKSSNASTHKSGYRQLVEPRSFYKGTPSKGLESGTIGTPGTPDVAPWITEVVRPGAAEAVAAIDRVKALTDTQKAAAWGVLHKEFEVQLLVWHSPLLERLGSPKIKDQATLRTLTEAAFSASGAGDQVEKLTSILQKNAEFGELFNKATKQAIVNVVEVEGVAAKRRDLVNNLGSIMSAANAVSFGDNMPRTEEDLDIRIAACRLGDLGLEYRIRRVLGLSLGDLRERWKRYRHEAFVNEPWQGIGSGTARCTSRFKWDSRAQR